MFEYEPFNDRDPPFDSERCKASVPYGGRRIDFHQCLRKPWKDGWCKQHHPDAVVKRRAQSEARWKEKQARKRVHSPVARLRKAQEEIARLNARIAELEADAK